MYKEAFSAPKAVRFVFLIHGVGLTAGQLFIGYIPPLLGIGLLNEQRFSGN